MPARTRTPTRRYQPKTVRAKRRSKRIRLTAQSLRQKNYDENKKAPYTKKQTRLFANTLNPKNLLRIRRLQKLGMRIETIISNESDNPPNHVLLLSFSKDSPIEGFQVEVEPKNCEITITENLFEEQVEETLANLNKIPIANRRSLNKPEITETSRAQTLMELNRIDKMTTTKIIYKPGELNKALNQGLDQLLPLAERFAKSSNPAQTYKDYVHALKARSQKTPSA